MNLRNKKSKFISFGISVVLTLLIVISFVISITGNIKVADNAQAATVSSYTPSVLNLTEKGIAKDNFSGMITGGQNEYIYFGTNDGSAIKWRVLSTNEIKYESSGKSWLLWADKSLGTAYYNPTGEKNASNGLYYAFWGTSQIRATLNGGDYPVGGYTSSAPPITNKVQVVDSYYGKMFTPNEKTFMVPTSSYDTIDFGSVSGSSVVSGETGRVYATTNIVGAGQYTDAVLNGTTAKFAKQGADKSVIETTSNDYLFLLDYLDVNNKAYGFYDESDGKVYANKINSSWDAKTSKWYPSFYDVGDGNNNNQNGSVTVKFFKEPTYWLRNAGHLDSTRSDGLNVVSSGYINVTPTGYSLLHVRPAFNFSPSDVIYATASSVSSNGTTFAKVDNAITGKPAYKVYMQTSSYKNYNDSANLSGAPIISASDKYVTVSKSGQNGSAIILLADKSGNGRVVYQATAPFSSGEARATLPSGINASNYSITVLLADSIRGEEYAESITGSYTVMSPLSIPKTIPSVDYNGSVRTLDTLKSNLDWYNSLYDDVSVVQVDYLDSGNNVLSSGNLPKNAGKYKIRFTIIDTVNYQWPDKSSDPNLYRTIDFEINQIVLEYPSISDHIKTYNGGSVRFQLENFDPNYMDLSWKDSKYTGVNISKDLPPYSVSATTVGKYELIATINAANAINYKFSSTPKLEVEITPAELVIDRIAVSGGGNSSNFSIPEGTASISADIFVDINGAPLGSDVVPITVVIPYDSNRDITISQAINLDAAALKITSYQVSNQQLTNLDNFFKGTYELDVRTTDKNYNITLKHSAMLTVLSAGQRTNILWKLYEGNVENTDAKYRIITELNETGVKNIANNLVYGGEQFRFAVDLPDGYTLDNSYGQSGYFVEKISGSGNVVGKDAGEYKTSIKLVENGEVYAINWTVEKAKFDLTNVKWVNDGKLQYTGDEVEATLENLPDGLKAVIVNNKGTFVGNDGIARIDRFELEDGYEDNYELPVKDVDGSYIFTGSGDFEWTKEWEVVQAEIAVGKESDWTTKSYTDDEDNTYNIYVLKDEDAKDAVNYKYYETDSRGNILEGAQPIDLEDIEYSPTERKYYKAFPAINEGNENYKFTDGVTEKSMYSPVFTVGGGSTAVTVKLKSDKIEYNGKPRNVSLVITGGAKASDFNLTYYSGDVADDAHKLDEAPTDKGNYLVVITSNKSSVALSGKTEYAFEIIAATIKKDWNKNAKPYVLNLKYGQIDGIEYEIVDAQGNPVAFGDLAAGNKYQIKASIKEGMRDNYSFTDGTYETDWEEFELRAEDMANLQDPNDPKNTNYPQSEDNDPTNPDNPPSDDDNKGGIGSLEDLLEMLKDIPLWQIIAGIISVILIIIFLSKTAGYESRRKEAKRITKDKYKTYYAGAFLGLAMTGWTAIACVLIALAVASLVIMLVAKSRCKKAEREKEYAKDEYEKNEARQRDDNMRMMFMGMMGGNAGNNGNMGQGMPQGAYMGGGYGIGVEEMRLMINDAVAGLLPNVQQALPQQASTNDELVNRLLEQNEMLMHKLEEQQPAERIVEKEVVATSANDEAIKSLIEGQRIIMEKLSQQQSAEPQVVEKIVEKVVEVPVEVEKIVEKEVKVEVPVEVEKIVEKEVVKKVKVEVPVAVAAPSKPKKEVAPRLTLDEAYAILSKQQQKYFDGLRQYALSKPNSKEKKSTYFTVFGQSTVNPLMKLTIKKDTVVALFKMEDEYLKDIKRDATSDGTKVKVKETEVVISDAQACKVAKNMIDLREDQIERYQDLLKEQRAMNKKK